MVLVDPSSVEVDHAPVRFHLPILLELLCSEAAGAIVHRLPDVLVDVLIHFEVVEVLFEFVSESVIWTALFRVLDDLGAGEDLCCRASCTLLSRTVAAPLARSPEWLLGELGSVCRRSSLKLVRGCVTSQRKRCSSLMHQG